MLVFAEMSKKGMEIIIWTSLIVGFIIGVLRKNRG
jgi:hypothetical protein